MQTPKVSVIVPVYNAEPYLRRCLDSILAQTFTDFEAILVDDGSTDHSGAICDEYAVRDARFKTIHIPNGGVSSARNMGLKQAKGMWVAFVDADDCVSPDYLQHLYNGLAGADDDSILVWGSMLVNGVPKRHFHRKVMKDGEAALHIMRNGVLALSGPVSKLFSMRIIRENGILFPINIKMGEDGIFLQHYLNAIETVSFIENVDYYVHDTAGSLSKQINSFESEWECFVIWKHLITDYVYKYKTQFPSPNEVVWNNRVGKTFMRCLFSVTQQQSQWSLSHQWKTLKSIPAIEYREFYKYYRSENLTERICKFLTGNQWLLLFVLIINCRRLIDECQK